MTSFYLLFLMIYEAYPSNCHLLAPCGAISYVLDHWSRYSRRHNDLSSWSYVFTGGSFHAQHGSPREKVTIRKTLN